jgi:pyruvate,water dikinase
MLRIVDLCDPEAGDAASFGGKAAGLARLGRAGAPVPEGFAVEATRLEPKAWPAPAREEFRRRLEGLLAAGPVAIRSSALEEDGAQRSFAGIFETVLGVTSVSDAIEAASHCIASGDATRFYAYAGPRDPVPVGLVVQRQVGSRSAGVCFTRDPLGRDGAVLLEAVSGCGDRLVSGEAQPEAWRVYRSALGPLEARREHCPGEPELLRAGDAAEIARHALELEAALGQPLDLEWARDAGDRLWWLQARPITAAVEPTPVCVERSAPEADDGPVTVWSNFNVRETMPDPLPPLVWSLWRDRLLGVLLRAFVPARIPEATRRALVCADRVAGRIYWNLNGFLAVPIFGWTLGPLGALIDPGASQRIGALRRAGVLRARRIPDARRLWAATVVEVLRGLPRVLRGPAAALAELRALHVRLRREAERPLAPLTIPELVAEVRRLTDPDLLGLHRYMGVAIASACAFELARLAFRAHPEAERRLAVGIRGNPTTEMSLALDALVERAAPLAELFERALPTHELLVAIAERAEGQAFLAELGAFLEQNGQRGPGEFDLSVPRWREDPGWLLACIRAGLREPGKESLRERFARLARERREAIDGAIAASPRWKRPLLAWLASAVERSMPLREAPKHHGLLLFEHVRTILLEIGSRLAALRVLASRDDVFFLDWREIEETFSGRGDWSAWRDLVGRRRAELARFSAEPAQEIVRSDGVPVPEPEDRGSAAGGGVLLGTGIATGRVTGRTRVLHTPDPHALAPGEILVVRHADPGWTPLFSRAAGLVMEVGGVMCHAAVVAREMGLPAVFGVRNATHLLTDGSLVTVDGVEGTVTPA